MSAAREPAETTAERVARNDALFREANEVIRATAERSGMEGLLPALCECADPACTELIQVTPREYEAARSNPTWFINVRGHHVNAHGWERVLSENSRFALVEKLGEAGEIAAQLDPRSPSE